MERLAVRPDAYDPNALTGRTKAFGSSAKGFTPLHLAASREEDDQREDILTLLLAYGANTMTQDVSSTNAERGTTISGGRTALHRLALNPDPYGLLLLMEAQFAQESLSGTIVRSAFGQVIKQISDDDGRTVLHIASGRDGDFYTIDYLLRYGFSADEPDATGMTPLMFAAQKLSDVDTFMSMLESSEAPCKASNEGATVENLLTLNPILSKVDPSGQTLTPLAELKKRCLK